VSQIHICSLLFSACKEFGYKDGLRFNWRQLIEETSVPDIIREGRFDQIENLQLNLAFSDLSKDTDFAESNDPNAMKIL